MAQKVPCFEDTVIDGTWYYFNKGKSPEGALTYTGVTKIMGSSELGSDKDTVVGKMVTMYKNRGATYPAEVHQGQHFPMSGRDCVHRCSI